MRRANEELAKLRRAEFAASCKILGIAHGEVLAYSDGKLDHADLYPGRGRSRAPDSPPASARDDHLRSRRRPHRAYRSCDGGHLRFAGLRMGGTPRPLSRTIRAGTRPTSDAKALLPHCRFQPSGSSAHLAAHRDRRTIEIGQELFDIKAKAFQQHTTQAPLFEKVRKTSAKRWEESRCFISRQPAVRVRRSWNRICSKMLWMSSTPLRRSDERFSDAGGICFPARAADQDERDFLRCTRSTESAVRVCSALTALTPDEGRWIERSGLGLPEFDRVRLLCRRSNPASLLVNFEICPRELEQLYVLARSARTRQYCQVPNSER